MRGVYAREERGSSQKYRNQVENRQLDVHLILFTVAHVKCPAFGGAVWHFHKKNQCRASTTFFSKIVHTSVTTSHRCETMLTEYRVLIQWSHWVEHLFFFFFFFYYVIFTQEYPISAQHCSPWGSCITCMTKQTSISIHSVIIQ